MVGVKYRSNTNIVKVQNEFLDYVVTKIKESQK